jgi:hypothetical protein
MSEVGKALSSQSGSIKWLVGIGSFVVQGSHGAEKGLAG